VENCLVLSSPAPLPLNLYNSCDTQEGVFKVLWWGRWCSWVSAMGGDSQPWRRWGPKTATGFHFPFIRDQKTQLVDSTSLGWGPRGWRTWGTFEQFLWDFATPSVWAESRSPGSPKGPGEHPCSRTLVFRLYRKRSVSRQPSLQGAGFVSSGDGEYLKMPPGGAHHQLVEPRAAWRFAWSSLGG